MLDAQDALSVQPQHQSHKRLFTCDIECNFDLGNEGTLPYDVVDALRQQHGIYVTGLSTSRTHKGNLYRSYALLGGRV